jgi:GntR family transcriptional regulator/MocR family aminotransferase
LYLSLKELIINKTLPYGAKLPSTRILAEDLKVSRSTVLKAIDILCFERFIIAKQGAGYFVCYTSEIKKVAQNENEKLIYPTISKRAKLFEKYSSVITDNFSKKNIAFRPGLPPLDIFPVKTWKNLSQSYWRSVTPTNLSYAPSEGIDDLRISISNYLKVYRNIDCDYKQVVIVTGSLHSLYLVGNAVINRGDKILMENPTFPRAYNLFKSLKAKIIPCEIDKKGLMINTVKDTNAKLIYTTPSNQYPLGVKMSKKRRKDLLNWASRNNSLIIEDDYDHEFSNWEKPIPSLFSLDNEDRVIYQGTFNKLLHPSLRIGYVILPKYLLNPVQAIYEQSSRFVSISNQMILNSFITKDFLVKHIRNVIETSKERKTLFEQQTKSFLKIHKKFNGLHIIGELKSKIDDRKLCKQLLENNVVAFPLSNYFITEEKKQGFVMGFSSVNNKMIKEKTAIMKSILTQK